MNDDEFLGFLNESVPNNYNSVTVEPVESEDILRLSDRTFFGIAGLDDIGVSVGDIVTITYTGEAIETYPTGINVVSWAIFERGGR